MGENARHDAIDDARGAGPAGWLAQRRSCFSLPEAPEPFAILLEPPSEWYASVTAGQTPDVAEVALRVQRDA